MELPFCFTSFIKPDIVFILADFFFRGWHFSVVIFHGHFSRQLAGYAATAIPNSTYKALIGQFFLQLVERAIYGLYESDLYESLNKSEMWVVIQRSWTRLAKTANSCKVGGWNVVSMCDCSISTVTVSSAHKWALYSRLMEDHRGSPRTDPWGTPLCTVTHLDWLPFNTTHCLKLGRHELSQSKENWKTNKINVI